MAQGPQCNQVNSWVVVYRSFGGFIERTPCVTEQQLPSIIQEIGGPDVVVQLIPCTQDGQPANCCPDGYDYDPNTNSCMKRRACNNPNNVLKNPDGTCPANYVVDPTDPGCCKPAPPCQNPNNVPQNADGSCPTGYVPDGTDPGCCKPAPQQPPGPGDGDELDDCCTAIVFELQQLVLAVQNVNQSGGQQNSDCCDQVVQGIGGITSKLAQIVKLLATIANNSTGGTPVDLTPVVNALEDVRASIDALPNEMSADTTRVVDALDRIAAATTDSDKCVCDALNAKIPPQPDWQAKVKTFSDYLVQNSGFDGGEGQIIDSTPPP